MKPMKQVSTLQDLAIKKAFEVGAFEEIFQSEAKTNPDADTFAFVVEGYLNYLFKQTGVMTPCSNFIEYLTTVNVQELYRCIELFKCLSKDEIKTINETKLFCLLGTAEAFNFAYDNLKIAEKSESQKLRIIRYFLFNTDCSRKLLIHACEKMNCFKMLKTSLCKLSDVQFQNFIKSLKCMFSVKEKLGELELLCLLGTSDAFDSAVIEFDLNNKSIEEKQRILPWLLSGANCDRTLFLHACEQMECFQTLGKKLSEFPPEKFKNFINLWKRIPFSGRFELGEKELLCLLGTKDAVDESLKKLEEVRFIELIRESEHKKILKYLLLNNDRSLLEYAAGKMGLIRSGIFWGSCIDLSYEDFSEWNLNDVDLHGIDFSCAKFYKTKLKRAPLFGANVRRANFIRAELQDVDLRRVENVKTAIWNNAKLIGANLSGMDLESVDGGFSTGNASDYNLGIPSFRSTDFTSAKLYGASLAGSDCENAIFDKADLNGANLSDTTLIGARFEGAHLQKTTLGNAKLNNASFVKADLSSADFHHVKNRRFINRYDEIDVATAILFAPIKIPLYLLGLILETVEGVFETMYQEILPPEEPPFQPDVKINFEGAQAESADLGGLSIKEGNFKQTNFKNAKIADTVFKNCDTDGADFSGASSGFFHARRPWSVLERDKKSKKTRVKYLSFFNKDAKATLISLLKEYLAGQYLVGILCRSYVEEVKDCIEISENNAAITAEGLILILAGKLKDTETGRPVNREGALFKIMDEFCLMRQRKSFDDYLKRAEKFILTNPEDLSSLRTVGSTIATAA